MLLAIRHDWTPEQVARMDEDFIVELLARERAGDDVEAARHKREQRRAARRGHRQDSEEAEVD